MSFVPKVSAALLAIAITATAALAQSTYLGVDRNDYPGDTTMKNLRQTFSFTGYWLNSPPGEKRNTWQGHRETVDKLGYGFLLLFNGREYAYLKASGNAARVGRRDAGLAVRSAQREGFSKDAIIFLDQEQGGRMLPEQLAYILAWVDAVKRGGYRAGIYCSGIPVHESSTVSVTTANDVHDHAGGREIHFFISNDQCPPSSGCTFPKPAPDPGSSGIAYADAWQFAQSPRRPEMTSSCSQTYAKDGSCYAPNMPQNADVYIDVDTATSPDPSHVRKK